MFFPVRIKRIACKVASAQIAAFVATKITRKKGILDIPMVQKGKFSAGADELVMALKKVDLLYHEKQEGVAGEIGIGCR